MSEEPLGWDEFIDECETGRRSRGKCTVGAMLDTLDDEARAKVEQALGNDALTHASIYAALKKRLGNVAPQPFTIGRHRRRDCQCSE